MLLSIEMNYTIAVFSYNHHQNLLPYCLKSIKKNCCGYNKIVVVWDDYVRERSVDFDAIKQQTGVNFDVVLHTEILDWPDKIGQWGWIKQQLAKLLCYRYINDQRTFVIDSDLVVLKDPELFENGKTVVRYHSNQPIPNDYKFFMKKYLGILEFSNQTWVGSSAVLEHDVLVHIDKLCISNTGLDLVQCVDYMLNNEQHNDFPFSEFEIYGHVCNQHYPDRFIFKDRNWTYPQEEQNDCISIAWADNHATDLEQRYANLWK